jgi:hypothetical protein
LDKIGQSGVNSIIEFSISEFLDQPLKYLKIFIIEMKVQIERWDLIMDHLFVHPSIEKYLLSQLDDAVNKPIKKGHVPDIWGCEILINDHVPNDMLIGKYELLSSNDNKSQDVDDGRDIVLGKLDLKMLDKINQMKAFW